jgi:hypothetical protein
MRPGKSSPAFAGEGLDEDLLSIFSSSRFQKEEDPHPTLSREGGRGL